jgi:hypothetical protein
MRVAWSMTRTEHKQDQVLDLLWKHWDTRNFEFLRKVMQGDGIHSARAGHLSCRWSELIVA